MTYSDNDAQDYTTRTVEGAQAQLMYHCHHQSPGPSMSRVESLLRKESKKQRGINVGSWSRSLKLFGKSPWHRKASAGSEASTSSSVRDVLRGRAPVTSPVSDLGVYFCEVHHSLMVDVYKMRRASKRYASDG